MLIQNIKKQLSCSFLRNVSWLGGAELVNRVFRLGTTVTLARTFSPEDYGLMAVIYTIFEFANAFTLRGGLGAKIVQADEQDVKIICNTCYWLNWILCGLIFLVQCIVAFPIAYFYENNQLILPICTVALMYLFFPLFLINTALIERENRLKITALCNATQSFFANLITVILAILGLGVWAIVWPMVLTAPIWIVITWRNHPWRPPNFFQIDRWREITSFGGNLLGVDLLNRLRLNIDYLIIGRFLGIEALGLYYFAFNAGLGISMNVMNSFSAALFPYFCEVRGNRKELKQRFFSSLKKICTIVFPLVILQSSLAPLYVPIIFGEKWIPAIPILIVVCLSALPFPFDYAIYHLLNAIDKSRINLYFALLSTVIFAVFVLFSVQWGIFTVALSGLVCRGLEFIVTVGLIKYAFAKKNKLITRF